MADRVDGRKQKLALPAIKLLGEHATKCNDDDARRKAIRSLTAVVADMGESDLVLPAAQSLGSFGADAGAAVAALEERMITEPDFEKAIEGALVKIRGKPELEIPEGDDDLLPLLD